MTFLRSVTSSLLQEASLQHQPLDRVRVAFDVLVIILDQAAS